MRLITNIASPKPEKPELLIASPPTDEPIIELTSIAALFRLIIVPRLSGICSRASILIVVIVVPAAAVPIILDINKKGVGRGKLK